MFSCYDMFSYYQVQMNTYRIWLASNFLKVVEFR
jgi:hypothetical protein